MIIVDIIFMCIEIKDSKRWKNIFKEDMIDIKYRFRKYLYSI